MANFAAADLNSLVRIVKRKLKKLQYLAPPDQRLPGRHWPQNRTLVNACITSSTWLVRRLTLGRDEGDDFEFDVNRGPYQRADD